MLLSGSDWTQLADAPLSAAQKKDWKTYRQTLRELPQQATWPEVEWPAPPAAPNTATH